MIEDEIKTLELKYNLIGNCLNKLKGLIQENNEVDSYLKIKLFSDEIDVVVNNIENILYSVENKEKLTDEDIEKINYNVESKKLFNTFFPIMILYKLHKRI